jgi:hypothetical protein
MIPPETAAIKPKANNVAAKPDKAAAKPDRRGANPRRAARIDKWTRDRLIHWRDSCWQCRTTIVPGRYFRTARDGALSSNLSRRVVGQQEVAARRALGLDWRGRE